MVDSAWLTKRGYSRSLQTQYVAGGWLEQPTRGVYRRPRGALSWQQAIISLQTILASSPIAVGGRTALELQGFAHYLPQQVKEVHLYGPKQPPSWLFKLPLDVRFVFHNSRALFTTDAVTNAGGDQSWDLAKGEAVRGANPGEGLVVQSWGQWDWLILSAPERALFELLNRVAGAQKAFIRSTSF